jgi:hypothetical protein
LSADNNPEKKPMRYRYDPQQVTAAVQEIVAALRQ